VTLPPITFPPPRPAQSKSRQAVQALAGAVIGGGLALALGPFLLPHPIVVLLSWIPAVIVHELGHILCGRIAGYRLLVVWLGPMQFTRSGARWRARFSWRFLLRGATMSAPDRWRGDAAARREMLLFIAGGSLANFVVGVPLLFVPDVAMRIIGGMSIMAGALSWIPVRGSASDGTRLQMILANDVDAVERRRVFALALLSRRVPPPQWPTELILALESAAGKETASADAAAMAHYHALDRLDIAAAHGFLQRAINAARLPTQRAGLALEAAIFEATWRGDAENAQALLARAGRIGRDDAHGALLAQAAIERSRPLLERARAKAFSGDLMLRRTTLEELEKVCGPDIPVWPA